MTIKKEIKITDEELFGKYYNRAEIHVIREFIFDLIFAGLIWYLTSNWFYGFLCVCFAYVKTRQLNSKNRDFEILNRLDEIEQQIKELR